jgi:hypothetical protein
MVLTKDNIESVFKEKVNELSAITVNTCLDLIVDFYNNNLISDVDTNYPESDMLLFEYGTYDWQDGKGENFSIGLTRQFYTGKIGEGELFNLQLLLYYDKDNFDETEPYNKWSDEFDTIEDWAKNIIKTDGFKRTENMTPKSYDVFITKPD